MKSIDLDSYDPGYSLEPIAWLEKKHRRKPYEFLRQRDSYSRKGPGLDPAKLLDWRKIERRRAELFVMQEAAHERFWNALRTVGGKPKKNREKWVMLDEDTMIVIRGDRDGYSLERVGHVVEELVNNDPYRSGAKFVLVKPGEGGSEVKKLLHHRESLQRAFWAYDGAFWKAISDRISAYAKEIRKYGTCGYVYPVRTFLVRNEGRTYAFQLSSRGDVSLLSDEVLSVD
jgi:hypothetical protein